MPRPRHAFSTAMRPMWPSRRSRPVATAVVPMNATAWSDGSSMSSSSISRGTPCSSTNTAKRIGAAYARADSQGRSSMMSNSVRSFSIRGEKYNGAMKSLWSDAEAAQFTGPLGLRVYTSRLLGRDRSLVLHGGGNTSVKLRQKNLFGEEEDVLYVKGSGWDLETIEPAGFTPVALGYVRRLASLPRLADPQMVNELNTHMLRAGAPSPSVETILHAILPHKYVDHTHADAVLSVSNAPEGEKR